MAFAIFLGVGGAFASKIKTRIDCNADTQYYLSGSTYFPAGLYGVQYYCYQVPLICTYYQPNPISQPNVYNPCVIGEYEPIR